MARPLPWVDTEEEGGNAGAAWSCAGAGQVGGNAGAAWSCTGAGLDGREDSTNKTVMAGDGDELVD